MIILPLTVPSTLFWSTFRSHSVSSTPIQESRARLEILHIGWNLKQPNNFFPVIISLAILSYLLSQNRAMLSYRGGKSCFLHDAQGLSSGDLLFGPIMVSMWCELSVRTVLIRGPRQYDLRNVTEGFEFCCRKKKKFFLRELERIRSK